jgi:hypothetical protein
MQKIRSIKIFNLYKVATESSIVRLLKFTPDQASIIQKKFGRRAHLYASWMKEYISLYTNKKMDDFNHYLSTYFTDGDLFEYHYIDEDRSKLLEIVNPYFSIFESGQLFNKFKNMKLEEAMDEYAVYINKNKKIEDAFGSIRWRGELKTEINGSVYHFKNVGEECPMASMLMHNCGQILSSDFGSQGEYSSSVDMSMVLIIKDDKRLVGITTVGYINGYSHIQNDDDYEDEIDGKFIVNAEAPGSKYIENDDVLKALNFYINYNNLKPAIVYDYESGYTISDAKSIRLISSENIVHIWMKKDGY